MGPLWSGQGTVPHCTVSDLLSTDVLVSSPGTLLGAKETSSDYKRMLQQQLYIPSVGVISVTSADSLLVLPNTAATFTVQILPGLTGVIVWLVAPPLGTDCTSDIVILSQNRTQEIKTL